MGECIFSLFMENYVFILAPRYYIRLYRMAELLIEYFGMVL